LEQGNDRNDTAAEEQISGPDCSQIFLQDPKGKTHTLIFKNYESLAKNLLTHSFHLLLPPPQEIYLLSGRRVLNLDESLSGNDLPQEPLLCVMLRCRGGMRGAPKSPARGSPGAKGRGTGPTERGGRQMGGSDGDVVPFHHTPPSRGGRGRGTGNHKRQTVVHSGTQETIDEGD